MATLLRIAKAQNISIHALREEGDPQRHGTGGHHPISIHALREEGDKRSASSRSYGAYFYPRPPRGGRRGREVEHTLRRVISIHALREEGDTRMAP